MLADVTFVKYVRDYRLYLEFEDGAAGEVNLEDCVGDRGMFIPLADKKLFAEVRVDPILGTIYWSNGADIAPEMLYERVKSS